MSARLKRILYLTDQGLTVNLVEGRRLCGRRHYGTGDTDLEAFARDLRRAPAILTRLVLDITEEEFHEEKIPHIFSHDQRRMLERRRKQRFRGGRWSYQQRQGREPGGRRDDRFLISGITREEVLQRWLKPLMVQCVPLDVITSVPLLAPRLARLMRVRESHVLIVSHGERGGIRQTYLAEGHLKASRLAPTPGYDEGEYAIHILEEVRRMKQFLTGAHLLPFGKTLHLYFIGSAQVIAQLGPAMADEGIRLHGHPLERLEKRLKLQGCTRHEDADAFFSLLAAGHDRLPSYATLAEKRCWYQHRMKRAFSTAASVVLVAGALVSGQRLAEHLEQRQLESRLRSEALQFEKRREQLAARRPAGEVSGFVMQDVVRFARAFEPLEATPFDYLPAVGQSLMGHPAIRLQSIDYRLASQTPVAAGGEASEGAGAAPRPKSRAVPLLVLEGQIAPQGRSYRQVHLEFSRWVAHLGRLDGLTGVEVLRWPLEVRPDRTLVMEDAPVSSGQPLSFSLRLTGRALL